MVDARRRRGDDGRGALRARFDDGDGDARRGGARATRGSDRAAVLVPLAARGRTTVGT